MPIFANTIFLTKHRDMFNKGDKKDNAANNQDSINLIGAGTSIKGDIAANGDIRIDGHLIGTVNAKGKLVLGPNGHIEGEVFCKSADVSGNIKGNLTVSELTHLKATAKFSGDINTNKLAIDPGASFSGNCAMGGVIKEMNNAIKREQRQPAEEKVA
jgi:cytoskeletal protein CcmA (bactofilin family)